LPTPEFKIVETAPLPQAPRALHGIGRPGGGANGRGSGSGERRDGRRSGGSGARGNGQQQRGRFH
jgi:hypothetical protein